MAETQNQEILHDFYPLMRAYKNGRIQRFLGLELAPPSLDSDTGVLSKDIIIHPDTNLSARLYLPKAAAAADAKLPLLLYFHGGGFVIESAFSAVYHKHLNLLTAKSQAIAVSVNYRLAPEDPLPAAYDDAWRALQWAVSDEEIGRHADLSRVFLGGDSAGGNIAHYIGVRQGVEKLGKFNLVGIFLNCPFFNGEETLRDEEMNELYPKRFLDELWRYACPSTVGSDDPLMNPAKDSKLGELGCKKVLVYVAEKDGLRARGWYYKEVLEKSGWDGEIEVVEVKGEDHVFSVLDPTSENSLAMVARVASFINA